MSNIFSLENWKKKRKKQTKTYQKTVKIGKNYQGVARRSPKEDIEKIKLQIRWGIAQILSDSYQPSQQRFYIVGGILLSGILGLLLNLYNLQIVRTAKLKEEAQNQQQISKFIFVPRRSIIDRNGNVLAFDRPGYTLDAHPKYFKKSPQEIAEKLAKLLEKNPAEIRQKFAQGDIGITIASGIEENLADRIAALNIDGLDLILKSKRIYPYQQNTAEIVGFVDFDNKGQAGLEQSQTDILERKEQKIVFSRSSIGTLIPERIPGLIHQDDLRLQLTIDHRLQRAARIALLQQMKQFKAKRGTVIVMDARDGSLLSLVNEPTYDPNRYFEVKDTSVFKNWALTDLYEPGSTFKPINVAIALEAGVIKADSKFNDEGRISVDGWPIQNYDFSYSGGHGPLSVTDIIKYSSNVGMVHIVEQMKSEIYYNWLERLGLGQITGIDLPAETPGQIKTRQEFIRSRIEAATTAFGQGFSLTPIQMAQLHASLANGGKIVTPHVIKGLFDNTGQLYWQPEISPPQQIFSLPTTQAVLSMMEKVVSEGTGKPAQIPGYRIAGKTGTAQKAFDGSYSDYKKITSFVGILPVNAPRYVVLAVVDEPQGGAGATVAAPVVKSVMESLIGLEKIPPIFKQEEKNKKP